jgi:hypothetical protein
MVCEVIIFRGEVQVQKPHMLHDLARDVFGYLLCEDVELAVIILIVEVG